MKQNKKDIMKAIITEQAIKRGNGYGQYIVTGRVNGIEVTARTTDSETFDWFSDDSNEEKHQDAVESVNMMLEIAYDNL